MSVLVCMAAVICCACPPGHALRLDYVPPSRGWRQLETAHFNVFFSPGQDRVAQRVANNAEAVHAELAPFLSWTPTGRTSVIVTDNTDEANAVTAPLPHRAIVLNLSQPAGEPGNHQDWLYEVMVHEYTHVLQSDMIAGVPALVRSVFGRAYLPNFIQPVSQIEGLAVYAETEFTGFGRNHSAYDDGVLRSFVNDSTWPSPDQAAVFSPRWPVDAPYIFGGAFIDDLAKENGRSSLAKYEKGHSRLLWPFQHSVIARGAYGADFGTLWRRWQDRSVRCYRGQIDSIRGAGPVTATQLTATGYDKTSLTISPDGRRLAWIEYNQHRYPSLQMYDTRTGAVTTVHEGLLAGSLCFSPGGDTIVFGKRDYTTSWTLRYDLYTVDVRTNKAARLTRGLRAHDPAWSPDGRTVLFVRDSLGANALATIDVATGSVAALTGFDRDSRYSHPAFSPDGRRAAMSVWCPGGFQDIYLFDLPTHEFTPLFVDRAQDLSPAWSGDGESIVFASDRTGVWNTFRYDLDLNKLYQLTNAVGGSFYPVSDREGRLYGLDLNAGGFDLCRSEAVSTEGRTAAPFVDPHRYDLPDVPDSTYASRPYRPLASLAPFVWLPMGFADERGMAIGLWCFGCDALMQRYYQLAAGCDPANGRPAYDLAITDASFPLRLTLSLSDRSVRHDITAGATTAVYWERQQSQELAAGYTLRRVACQIDWSVSYHHRLLSAVDGVLPGFAPCWSGHLSSLRFSCGYANARQHGWSISPEQGRALYGETELYRRRLGSDINQTVIWGRWMEYIGLPFAHHVLLLDGRAGAWRANGVSRFDANSSFDPRGYPSGTLYQTCRACATAEYRFPIAWIERGHDTWPLYWKNIHGALFIEAGADAPSLKGIASSASRRSIGAELRSDWLLGYALPARLQIGYARALRWPGANVYYWSLDLSL